jgi:hypothetical protein
VLNKIGSCPGLPHVALSSRMFPESEVRKIAEDVRIVSLPDGRRLAYREQGAEKARARKSLLVLHGLGSSRVAGMPGKCKL